MTALEILLRLISKEVCGHETSEDIASELNDENIKELYAISKTHDLAHLVGSALKKTETSVSPELLRPFYDEHLHSVFRYRRFVDELSVISNLFEEAQIDHIALKGALLRDFYPEPWMRTSCDIDILVKNDDLARACELLSSKAEYKQTARTGHDVSFYSPTGVHLELHFSLVEDSIFSDRTYMFESVWDRTVVADGKKHTYLMTEEMFYFYHIAHMAKHFLCGGCGIRTFLDLWILENRVDFNAEKRAELISEGKFSSFAENAKRLAAVWFDGAEHDQISKDFERFVLCGGAYGTVENEVNLGVAGRGTRAKYIFRRIFPQYNSMKNLYPVLERRKFLLPFCHVRRWFRIIFRGGVKKARAEIRQSTNVSSDELDSIKKLISELGLAN